MQSVLYFASHFVLMRAEQVISPAAEKQAAGWRKDPVQPYFDGRLKDPFYNPVVDDWVDINNPRWKVCLLLEFWPTYWIKATMSEPHTAPFNKY